MKQEQKVLTIRQLARAVGFSTVAIRSWCKQGIVPGAYKCKRGRWQVPYPADQGLRVDTGWIVDTQHMKQHGWTRLTKKERVQLAQLLSEQGIPLVAMACRVGRKTIELYRPIDWSALP